MAKAYLYSLTLGIIIILSILSAFNLKYSCDEKLSELKIGRLLTYEFKKPNGKTFKVYKDKIIDIKSHENQKFIHIHRQILDKSGKNIASGYYDIMCHDNILSWNLKEYLFEYEKLWTGKGVARTIVDRYTPFLVPGDNTKIELQGLEISATLNNMGLTLIKIKHVVSNRKFEGFSEINLFNNSLKSVVISSIHRSKENNKYNEYGVKNYYNGSYGLIRREVKDINSGKLKHTITLTEIN